MAEAVAALVRHGFANEAIHRAVAHLQTQALLLGIGLACLVIVTLNAGKGVEA